jgi:hypothetical protein
VQLEITDEAVTALSGVALLNAFIPYRLLSSTSQSYTNFASLEEIMKTKLIL